MVKYYKIPISLEKELSDMVNYWLANGQLDSYTVITGIYQSSEVLNELDSLVYSKNILGEINYIKNGFKDTNNNTFKLVGYCLEVNFDLIAPQFNYVIEMYPEILIYNSAEEYLKSL